MNDEMQEPMQTDEAPVLVIDVPFGTTEEAAGDIIGEPFAKGFYIHRAMEWPGGCRVIYIRRVKPVAKPDTPVTREASALQFLRENRELSTVASRGGIQGVAFPSKQAMDQQ